jgi:phosphatidylinositol alpha-mannosyltransferase
VKIGILCENYFPTLGGEQEHIYHLRRHLESPADGSPPCDVRIIVPIASHDSWHGPADDDHVLRPARSIRVHGLGSASESTLTPRAYFALRALFARERFDLLHIHAPCDIGLPIWALWTFDGPIVGTIHSYFSHGPVRTLLSPVYRYVMRRMTRVIAVSEAARDTIGRYADFECAVIGNGVDCDAFAQGRPRGEFADGMVNVLSVGRLEQRNGIDLVIDAFALVARDRHDVRLIIAGDGPLRRKYEAQARALPPPIAQRIVFLGAVWGERCDLYATAHAFALGARKASFSILLLEALAAGLRVAAIPGEGTTTAGDHWSLAVMARSGTANDYADALRSALVPVTTEYSSAARAMARRHDWRVVVPRIRRVYDEAIALHGELVGRHAKNDAASIT